MESDTKGSIASLRLCNRLSVSVMNSLPFSQSCDNNRQPIGAVLQRHIKTPSRLLEIGSGTGQHGYYYSEEFPGLFWQPSDRAENLPAIQSWVAAAARDNYAQPIALDVVDAPAMDGTYDYLFSANTLHIMPWHAVEAFFRLMPRLLKPQALVFIYGPFNEGGRYTSDSNAAFDRWLKEGGAHRGIRDKEAIEQLALQVNLRVLEDNPMPANNRLLVLQYSS